jgi:glycosyltransferase involved in cell wall biosynthesis
MIQSEQEFTATPRFSIVIPVYNDWLPLDRCLESLERQLSAPSFEVIIVDDGSAEAAPEFIRTSTRGYPLSTIRQSHQGIPSARNQGIRSSTGAVLLFVDADCRLESNCLAALHATIAQSSQHDYFQLRLVGSCSSLVGRAEALRLITLQDHLLQSDSCIRYLNTAGFAIRRAKADTETGVFDPAALRAEDTLLLASLMLAGELPLFVPDAIVEHAIPLSLMACLRKDIWSVYLEARAYEIIASRGVVIRMSHRERLRMLATMWKTARQPAIGRSAWFVLLIRQVLQRTISFGCQFLELGPAEPR